MVNKLIDRFLFIIFFLFIVPLYLNAQSNQQMWAYQKKYKLKKDEIAEIFISNANNEEAKSNILKFRWVLFHNNILTMVANYKGHPYQYTLKLERGWDYIKMDLLPLPIKIQDRVYAFFQFVEFDKEKKMAHIDIFIKDPTNKILVKFKPEDER